MQRLQDGSQARVGLEACIRQRCLCVHVHGDCAQVLHTVLTADSVYMSNDCTWQHCLCVNVNVLGDCALVLHAVLAADSVCISKEIMVLMAVSNMEQQTE